MSNVSGRGLPEYRTGMNPRNEMSLLLNRIEAMLVPGRVKQVDYLAHYARVELKDAKGNGLLTDWLRWAEPAAGVDREWNPPFVGETVMLAAPSGNLNHAIIAFRIPTVDAPPIADNPYLSRKTWGKHKDQDFFDFPFWELCKKPGETHVWNYLPKKGEFRHEIGDKVLLHFSEEMLMFRIGNTQLVLRDGEFAFTIADDLNAPKDSTEIKATKGKIEVHTSHQASLAISSSTGVEGLPYVEAQVKGRSTLVLREDSAKIALDENSSLVLGEYHAALELKEQQTQLFLTDQAASLRHLDSVVMLKGNGATPYSAIGTLSSSLRVVNGSVSALATVFYAHDLQTGSAEGGMPVYGNGPITAVARPPLAVSPYRSPLRWAIAEGKGPKYPRTGKPRQ